MSAPTVTRWAREGRLYAVRTPSGRHRFHAGEVHALMGGAATWNPRVPGAFPAGHSQISQTERYIHASSTLARDAVGRMGSALLDDA